MTYSEKLAARTEATGSNLCLGIDPRPELTGGDLEGFPHGVLGPISLVKLPPCRFSHEPSGGGVLNAPGSSHTWNRNALSAGTTTRSFDGSLKGRLQRSHQPRCQNFSLTVARGKAVGSPDPSSDLVQTPERRIGTVEGARGGDGDEATARRVRIALAVEAPKSSLWTR